MESAVDKEQGSVKESALHLSRPSVSRDRCCDGCLPTE